MKYLESIVGMLLKAGLLQRQKREDGGYRMAQTGDTRSADFEADRRDARTDFLHGRREGTRKPRSVSFWRTAVNRYWNRLDGIDEYLSSVSIGSCWMEVLTLR